jgi:hypothetical protein
VRLEGKKQPNIVKNNHNIAPRERTATTNALRSKKSTGQQRAATEERSGATAYEDSSGVAAQDIATFSRSRVLSKEELAHSGQFRSELRAGVATRSSQSSESDSAIADDWPDSPSESLILQASQSMVDGGELLNEHQAVEMARPSPPVTDPKGSSQSLIQKLVTLFAGRKKTIKKDENATHGKPNPVSSRVALHTLPARSRRPDPGPAQPPVVNSSLPRLTHRQVIPHVQRPRPNRHVYRDILPAPEHIDTGRIVVAKDMFTPVTIQRGFNSPSSTTTPLPMHRRNHSAGNLLDRDGDAWARWYSKHPTPQSNPFSRAPSAEDMASQHTGDLAWTQSCMQGTYEMKYSVANLSSGCRGFEPVEDKYPFVQGLCW